MSGGCSTRPGRLRRGYGSEDLEEAFFPLVKRKWFFSKTLFVSCPKRIRHRSCEEILWSYMKGILTGVGLLVRVFFFFFYVVVSSEAQIWALKSSAFTDVFWRETQQKRHACMFWFSFQVETATKTVVFNRHVHSHIHVQGSIISPWYHSCYCETRD